MSQQILQTYLENVFIIVNQTFVAVDCRTFSFGEFLVHSVDLVFTDFRYFLFLEKYSLLDISVVIVAVLVAVAFVLSNLTVKKDNSDPEV